mgnify:CR=1 FL=1
MRIPILIFICLLWGIGQTFAQENDRRKEAIQLIREAIKLMDSGKVDESFPLLKKAAKLIPESLTPPYEMAYAYQLKKDYPKVIKILKKLTKHEKVNDRVFQLLGNAYDYNQQPEKAIQTYQAGLKKFPKSGKLYTEWGILEFSRKNLNEAVDKWEMGIKANPYHSSNYYWLTKIFRNTEERIWALLYGEMFMNLTSSRKRAQEVSQWLYESFKQSHRVKDSSKASVHLTKKTSIDVTQLDDPDKVIPFELTYTMFYTLSTFHFSKKIDIEAIYQHKKAFLEAWFGKQGKAKVYPNKLLDFQKALMDSGHLETYTYWVLGTGNFDEAKPWFEKNEPKFKSFVDWIQKNGFELTPQDKYSRKDY